MRHGTSMRSDSMGVENIVKEATELLDIGDLSSSAFSWSSSSSLELQLDRSAYNGVCQQVLELKILLLQLRRLLDWTNTANDATSSEPADILEENQQLREQLKVLQREVTEKDERIKELEKIFDENSRKGLNEVSQGRPNSLQDVSLQSRSSPEPGAHYKPCQHVWGPCANDHTHHHARRSHLVRRFQARSLSGGRQSRKRDSPLGILNRCTETERRKGLQ